MRILWSIHLYPPKHNCGAEYVAHHVNKYLISQGHEVRVMLLRHHGAPYTWDGVEVVPICNTLDAYAWADVVITHLDYTRHTVNMASIIKRPVIHFMHNDSSSAYTIIRDAALPQYMVHNSYWLQEAYNNRGFDRVKSIVLQPPCPADAYRILGNPMNSEYITLINLNENKGGYLFYRLAKAMTSKKFLGVVGSYDDGGLQPDIIRQLSTLENVTLMPNTPNIREVYQQTRVLLMLSRYESWGRTATEAMSNGIPVIYTATKGLVENIAGAGLMLEPRGERITDEKTGELLKHDGNTYPIEGIEQAINSVDNAESYKYFSNLALKRYKKLNDEQHIQLQQLDELLRQAQSDYTHIREGNRPVIRSYRFS